MLETLEEWSDVLKGDEELTRMLAVFSAAADEEAKDSINDPDKGFEIAASLDCDPSP